MKMLLFDIDGTLLKTKGAGRIALEKVFCELFGVENAWGNLKPDGRTDPAIIHEIAEKSIGRRLTRLEYKIVVRLYLEYFRKTIKEVDFELMPGISDLMPFLSGKKHLLLGLATGNFEQPSWLKLRRGNLHQFFSFGGFGSDATDRTKLTAKAISRGRKMLPKRSKLENIFVIGDTPHDVAVGKNLGVKTIAVATGSNKKSELKRYSPDFLFSDLRDVERFMDVLD